MQETVIINAEKRLITNSGENRRLREKGYLPTVLYGREMEPIALSVKKTDLNNGLVKYGRNAVFNINLPGDISYPIIVKEIQNDPVTGDFLHADFHQISLTEEIKIDVAVRIIGREALEAARILLIQQSDDVSVKCLPNNVPQTIEIDASVMSIGDSFTAGDIELPEGVVLETDPEQVIISLHEAKEHVLEEDEEGSEDGDQEQGDLDADADSEEEK